MAQGTFAITCWISEKSPTSRSRMMWNLSARGLIRLAPVSCHRHCVRLPELVAGCLHLPSGHLLLYPPVGRLQAVAKRDGRLPSQHVAQSPVVGIAAPDALRTGHVSQRDAVLAGDLEDHPRQFIDGDDLFAAEVQRLVVIRVHQAANSLDAVVDIAERPGLFSVPPDVDH